MPLRLFFDILKEYMRNLIKNFLAIFLIFLVVASIFTLFSQPFEEVKELSFTQLVSDINQGNIKEITVSGNNLEVVYRDDTRAKSIKETESALSQSLTDYGADKNKLQTVNINIKEESGLSTWAAPLLFAVLPLLLFGVFFWMIFRQAKVGATQAFDFTKARARLFGAEGHTKERITFKDVAGLKEAKEELKEIVDFLKHPKKFLAMGARIPKGVLLLGPPGCGKTLLARAVAGEARVPFFSIAGSELVEMFVGVGASIIEDTSVLIRTKNSTNLLPIRKFADQFYKANEEGLKNVEDVQTLGVDWVRGKKFFKSSNWKKVKSVYRHKVNEIHEIQFIGGKIKVTGDHSVFVRQWNHVVHKRVKDLKVGDILIGLPYSARGKYISKLPLGNRTPYYAKAHQFPSESLLKEITVWPLENQEGFMSVNKSVPGSIARILNLSEGKTISLKTLTASQLKNLVYKVKITPALLKLMGYYTAEGTCHEHSRSLRFSFGAHEVDLHQDCKNLMAKVFDPGLQPRCENNGRGSLVINYGSLPIAQFFGNYCGKGACNKHVPEFIWDLPKEYFVNYLDGLVEGDGYINKRKMIEFSSCSKQIILELRWLLNMHGVPCSVTKYKKVAGHRIKNGKPLPESTYWRITVARRINPLSDDSSPRFFKRPIIKKIEVKPYNGYVYDLCGCEGEAFFGGEKPILLHNSRVRDLFGTAKKAGTSIIFLDELDAIGRHRGTGLGGGHDEREQTLNQILVEMDGFERGATTIVIAATNRGDILDPALLRPGRFDRKVVLDLPDINDREEILKIHARGKPLALNINVREVAERTPGFSGADLANVVNEAAILAARKNKQQIFQQELLESIEKVLLGPERKSHILSKKEKVIAAFHEAGHALVSASLPETEPIRKISIVARGMAAGYTIKMPVEDRRIIAKSEFLAEIATLLGGYCAEKLKFNEITTGAANDLEKASQLARKLVKEYGMSSLGPISFGEKEEMIFLGKELGEQRNYSEKVASQIDQEVANFIKDAENTAKKVLSKKKKTLEKIAERLIDKETIEREEFEELMGQRKISAPKIKIKKERATKLKIKVL